jgi:hypothetical protein
MDEPTTSPEPSTDRTDYRPLQKYLRERYAEIVVLTFAQIEDLLGSALPAPARLNSAWWTDPEADGTPSLQSRSWTQAGRNATPNLRARTVRFERVPV